MDGWVYRVLIFGQTVCFHNFILTVSIQRVSIRRTRVAELREVRDYLRCGTVVQHLTLAHQGCSIQQFDDVRPRLVDGQYD